MKVNRKQFKLHRLRGAGMRRLAGSKYIISKKKVVGDREVEFIIAPPCKLESQETFRFF